MRKEHESTVELSGAEKIINEAFLKIKKEELQNICSLHYAAFKKYINDGATSNEALQLSGTVVAILMSNAGLLQK